MGSLGQYQICTLRSKSDAKIGSAGGQKSLRTAVRIFQLFSKVHDKPLGTHTCATTTAVCADRERITRQGVWMQVVGILLLGTEARAVDSLQIRQRDIHSV